MLWDSGVLVQPQWKHFRHFDMVKNDQIRLSNGIWRSWHIKCESYCSVYACIGVCMCVCVCVCMCARERARIKDSSSPSPQTKKGWSLSSVLSTSTQISVTTPDRRSALLTVYVRVQCGYIIPTYFTCVYSIVYCFFSTCTWNCEGVCMLALIYIIQKERRNYSFQDLHVQECIYEPFCINSVCVCVCVSKICVGEM